MTARVILRNLYCSNPVEFGSIWSYGAPHPIEDMTDPEYFRSARMSLGAGDQVRLCRTEGDVLTDPDNFVHEVQTANVLRSTAEGVELALEGAKPAKVRPQKRPSAVRDQKAATEKRNLEQAETYVSAQGEVRPNDDGKTFDVFVDGARVAEAVETNERAIQIAIGAAPLPKAA